MSNRIIKAGLAGLAVLTLSACAVDPTPQERRIAGAALGGIAGGAVGSAFGSGTGRVIATATGAVVGAVAGSELANPN